MVCHHDGDDLNDLINANEHHDAGENIRDALRWDRYAKWSKQSSCR